MVCMCRGGGGCGCLFVCLVGFVSVGVWGVSGGVLWCAFVVFLQGGGRLGVWEQYCI